MSIKKKYLDICSKAFKECEAIATPEERLEKSLELLVKMNHHIVRCQQMGHRTGMHLETLKSLGEEGEKIRVQAEYQLIKRQIGTGPGLTDQDVEKMQKEHDKIAQKAFAQDHRVRVCNDAKEISSTLLVRTHNFMVDMSLNHLGLR